MQRHAQWDCTIACVCVCVCIWVWNRLPSPPPYMLAKHTHTSPWHTCTHTQRKWSVQQWVWLTLPGQVKRDPGSISAALQSSEPLTDGLSSSLSPSLFPLLPDKFSTALRIKPRLSVLMQEWARHSFPLEAGFTQRISFFFFYYLIFHNRLDREQLYGLSLLRLSGWSDLCNKGFRVFGLWINPILQNKPEPCFPKASLLHSLSFWPLTWQDHKEAPLGNRAQTDLK